MGNFIPILSENLEALLTRLRQIVEKNLAVTLNLKNSMGFHFTSLIRTRHGNVARMKIVTVFYVNFSQNEWIWGNSHHRK